jgi:hypothetical protein
MHSRAAQCGVEIEDEYLPAAIIVVLVVLVLVGGSLARRWIRDEHPRTSPVGWESDPWERQGWLALSVGVAKATFSTTTPPTARRS